MVDDNIDDENPFSLDWLNEDVSEDAPSVIESMDGEDFLVSPLAKILLKIVDLQDTDYKEDISWEAKIIMPKDISEEAGE